MTLHEPGEPVQIRYPGGKDGWFRVECVLGDHDATESTPARAIRRVQAHADAKNRNAMTDDKTYSVIRFYQDSHPQLVIAEGLSLAEAQDWCRSPETSSATATEPDNVEHTRQHGPWFDGYREEEA